MYIKNTPGPAGAFPSPQSIPAKGLLYFPDELLEEFISYNGFVTLETDGDTVTALTPNVEAWEAWKAEQVESAEEVQETGNSQPVTWEELDAAYNEGRDSAYDS